MQGFRKFEKKFQRYALIKSAVFGLSCGIFAVSALWLVLKLRAVTFGVIWYILIGLGVAAATFGLCWLVCRPTEKKVAKKLDKDLRFGEKAQTMVEFQASQEDMARLQRTDADARLAVTPTKAVENGQALEKLLLSRDRVRNVAYGDTRADESDRTDGRGRPAVLVQRF